MTITKEDFAVLINAYADAKASKNQHLIKIMVGQLERALDALFPEVEKDPE